MQKNNKRVIILSIFITILVFFAIVGTAYGYFIANISANKSTNPTVSGTTAILSLTLKNGNSISAENIFPGWTKTLNFEVENTGNMATKYSVNFENITNSLIGKNNLTYNLSCSSSKTNCNSKTGIFPDTSKLTNIITNNIEVGEKHTYTFTVTFANSGDQSNDIGKSFYTKISIASEKS